MQTVPVAQATNDEYVLPERVQEALGQLVGAAKEGLLALSVEVGLGVLRELLEQEVDELVGPKGKWNPDRTAVRHGQENGEVTLGGRRVPVKRPRARTADGESELPLATYEHFADRDPLGRGRAGADAGRCLDPPVPPGAGAGRRAGRDRRAVDVEVGGVQDVRSSGPAIGCGSLMNRPLVRSAARGDHARRDRAARVHQHRRAGDHDRGREARARAVGGIERERDRRQRAAVRSGRPGRRRRAGAAVRDRRIEGPQESDPAGVR